MIGWKLNVGPIDRSVRIFLALLFTLLFLYTPMSTTGKIILAFLSIEGWFTGLTGY
ncbi:YgaP-like transmembrane domain [Syntrophomonas erecta]